MSEPITLYDIHGNPHTFVAPSEAHAQVIAGLLFEQPPAVPVPQMYSTPPGMLDVTTHGDTEPKFIPEYEPVLTPNDTQEVPAVATGRARRKQQGTGVL